MISENQPPKECPAANTEIGRLYAELGDEGFEDPRIEAASRMTLLCEDLLEQVRGVSTEWEDAIWLSLYQITEHPEAERIMQAYELMPVAALSEKMLELIEDLIPRARSFQFLMVIWHLLTDALESVERKKRLAAYEEEAERCGVEDPERYAKEFAMFDQFRGRRVQNG